MDARLLKALSQRPIRYFQFPCHRGYCPPALHVGFSRALILSDMMLSSGRAERIGSASS